jgi:hypothetical protein
VNCSAGTSEFLSKKTVGKLIFQSSAWSICLSPIRHTRAISFQAQGDSSQHSQPLSVHYAPESRVHTIAAVSTGLVEMILDDEEKLCCHPAEHSLELIDWVAHKASEWPVTASSMQVLACLCLSALLLNRPLP